MYLSVAANRPNSFIHFDPILVLHDPDWILLIRIYCWFNRINPLLSGINCSHPFPFNTYINYSLVCSEQTPRRSVS